ncbi:hypothetical protein MTBBW1_850028 [Desulfamplus magnetovallimortis]|uniref:Immunity protein 10 n=1 Tax=Desulfamplus magnetovallimortis TaxID=1246637 RepID=A0A1W1HKQ5_9BACT|nr:hypothetical protein [Desulfamplus magnetovallimortis]SLM33040.1 hypothetical protein MTBBW1_850028 [Desulfamplus magnetovallimortis]
MIIEFEATEFGVHEEPDYITCGASNTESDKDQHYFFLQRSFDENGWDDGKIYFEIDYKENGNYEIVTKCILNGNLFDIRLRKGCNAGIEKILVILPNRSDEIKDFANGLKKLFYNNNILRVI